MDNKDTICLLKECSAGIRMAVSSIDDVLPYLDDKEMMQVLKESKTEHRDLEKDIDNALHKMDCDSKEPNIMAKGMSKMKTNFMMNMKEDCDETAADLITDGCNMGIKSLYKYMNQYPAANEKTKDLCKRLITIEDQLRKELRAYL
jgi:hypothetical protein